MIPVSRADLGPMIAEARRQTEEVVGHFATLAAEDALWRPGPEKWSMTGHVAHLVIVNSRYLDLFEAKLGGDAFARLPAGDGPYRHPRIATWFAKSMEPPPKRRLRTSKSMVPDPGSDPAATVTAFEDAQRRLEESMRTAEGVDLGKVRFGSPFLPLLRLSLGTAFAALLGHNRRHIWLLHEVNRARPRG